MSHFKWNERMRMYVPQLLMDWEKYDRDEQSAILEQWERIRGSIPDRVFELERVINRLQAQLDDEADFERSCRLNSEIAELAGTINELWIWYRMDQELETRRHV